MIKNLSRFCLDTKLLNIDKHSLSPVIPWDFGRTESRKIASPTFNRDKTGKQNTQTAMKSENGREIK